MFPFISVNIYFTRQNTFMSIVVKLLLLQCAMENEVEFKVDWQIRGSRQVCFWKPTICTFAQQLVKTDRPWIAWFISSKPSNCRSLIPLSHKHKKSQCVISALRSQNRTRHRIGELVDIPENKKLWERQHSLEWIYKEKVMLMLDQSTTQREFHDLCE